jgi:hypothetical protein
MESIIESLAGSLIVVAIAADRVTKRLLLATHPAARQALDSANTDRRASPKLEQK